MAPVVVFVGAPGAGKTSVGRRVAERLNVEFIDTDQAIESQSGSSVAEIFINEGEPVFRALESEIVSRTLKECSGVVSLGGGAIVSPATRALVAASTAVWLQVNLADASQRVGMTGSRPLLLGNVRGTMLKMLEERSPMYAEVADLTVDTSGRAIRSVVDEVMAWLESRDE